MDKCVNGVNVPMTPDEEAAIQAEWDANTNKTPEQIALEDQARRLSHFNNEKLLKSLAIWVAQKLSVPLATARQEILDIYKTL